MVEQLKMLKTFVKFLCWFGGMLLTFGLASLSCFNKQTWET
jgi:hypothetical protein